MNNSTVNISFKKDLLAKIDQIAKKESRSRSELIREAARKYIEKKQKWESIFSYGVNQAKERELTGKSIIDEIAGYRERKRKGK